MNLIQMLKETDDRAGRKLIREVRWHIGCPSDPSKRTIAPLPERYRFYLEIDTENPWETLQTFNRGTGSNDLATIIAWGSPFINILKSSSGNIIVVDDLDHSYMVRNREPNSDVIVGSIAQSHLSHYCFRLTLELALQCGHDKMWEYLIHENAG